MQGIDYYYQVLETGETLVRCVTIDDDGRECAYSEHSSKDESPADGDGTAFPPDWKDVLAWSRTTKEDAELMLGFEFRD